MHFHLVAPQRHVPVSLEAREVLRAMEQRRDRMKWSVCGCSGATWNMTQWTCDAKGVFDAVTVRVRHQKPNESALAALDVKDFSDGLTKFGHRFDPTFTSSPKNCVHKFGSIKVSLGMNFVALSVSKLLCLLQRTRAARVSHFLCCSCDEKAKDFSSVR